MGKKTKVRFEGERAFGRIALSELNDERVATWTVRAVAGETRKFERPQSESKAAQSSSSISTEQLAVRIVDQRERPAIGLRCGTCEITAFASLDEQYAHFKSDWHCGNLKRKARGAAVVSEADFEAKKGSKKDSISAATGSGSDDSSVDSSSSSSEEEQDTEEDVITTSEPVVEFSDDKSVFKVFKNILPRADKDDFNPYVALDQIRASKFRWAVFLMRSGRFAGAVFEKEKALCHKTFQRYTTRRKQGGSQAAHDASGGKAKSAGATLRRYNEAALKQDVVELLTQWKDMLRDVELIFISTGKNDRPTFFMGKQPVLQADDPRLRRVPFATFRPTFEEVCRVRLELSSVKFAPLPPPPTVAGAAAAKKPSTASKAAAKADTDETTAVPVAEPAVPVVKVPALIQLAIAGELGAIKQFVETSDADVDVNVVDVDFMTPLHHAVDQNAVAVVQYLLDKGANPSLLDLRSRPPYFLCTSKETRNVFRRFMAANPDAWDYTSSQIPSALTDEMEQKKKEKEAEKRRRAKERKKQQKKEEADLKLQEEAAQAECERQIAAGLACDACGKYAGKSPLKRLEYKYCSSECVATHRRNLMSEAALKRFGG